MEHAYLAPALTRIPETIGMARDYEAAARGFMQDSCHAYVAGGSATGLTARRNLQAFEDLAMVPRVLADLQGADTAVRLPGGTLPHPVLLAPVAHQVLAHPGAERETARAAEAARACIVASTLSTCTLEQIATANGGGTRWFQLYLQPEATLTASLVQRAQRAGYSAIMVTVDAAVQVPDQQALRAGFRMPREAVAGNLVAGPGAPGSSAPQPARGIFEQAARNAPSMGQLLALREQTSLPVWIKGVMHPDDAVALRRAGFDGLVVSNHGGRGLDGAPASLAMLPGIRRAVGDDCPVLFDGGIRSGRDVFHALAQGADAVLVGRLQMYALAVAGALGVAHMLRLLREELEVCMALTGCASIAAIRRTLAQQGAA